MPEIWIREIALVYFKIDIKVLYDSLLMGNCIYKHQLSKRTMENTKLYTYENRMMWCKVLECYDGDTIKIAIKDRGHWIRLNIRMYGYDSPEMKPLRSVPNRDKIIKKAKKAKKCLEELILHRVVKIHLGKQGKYGRTLGTVYIDEGGCCVPVINVNQWMVEHRHGVPYFGGKK